MGSFSIWHWMIVIVLVVLMFGGRGKISGIMGDVAHGIRNFREGLKDPNERRTLPDGEQTAEIKKEEEIRS